MRTLYLECAMGAAGDMLLAALLELHPDKETFIQNLNALAIPKTNISYCTHQKCGITGTQVSVIVDGIEEESHDDSHHHEHHDHASIEQHHHNTFADISILINNLNLPEKVKADALAVYQLIAQAESHAHGQKVEQIHFHEVGTYDAVMDIVGVCWLIDQLAIDKIIASPVHVGFGHIHCAHGILPVPAPATAFILQDVPVYSGQIAGELCTPTGAALLKHFAAGFGSMPVMKIEKIGYGMGKKDFTQVNCLRAMLGITENKAETIIELICNLDDMTPEAIGYATEILLTHHALDVWTTAVQMKKNRPGVMLTCLCEEKDKEELLALIFKYTTTLGIREHRCPRYTLERQIRTISTSCGDIRLKEAQGYGVKRMKAEYDDLVKIAKERQISLAEAAELLDESCK